MSPPRSIFLGVTGASGAPYALGLARELAARDCALQLCISDAGVGVVAHELRLSGDGRASVTAAFLAAAGARATVFSPADFAAPPSSGSAFPDAAVVCPCSLSSAAEIALGTSRTLIHRAGAVAIKEHRPLVIVPRETPLSVVHLRRLLELSEAGAFIVPPMPGFYNRPESLQDCIDFVVGKILTVLGFSQDLCPAWSGLE
ncbi:MAG: UbiX family flavin prenyltransferase [Actinobacteria bacterium]|nr:UbiX family flavin prenyltransferase [Actinomycetota bacterium]